MKVLIVDDIGLIRRRLQWLISSHGFATETAESGRTALEILKNDLSIRAVVTDLHMPELDGLELFRQSRGIERVNDVGCVAPPVFLLLTADRDKRVHETAINMGFAHVMAKPPDHKELLEYLDAINSKPVFQPKQDDSAVPPSEPTPPTESASIDPSIIDVEDVETVVRLLQSTNQSLIEFGDTQMLDQMRRQLELQIKAIDESLASESFAAFI